jgi:hypothetical protein
MARLQVDDKGDLAQEHTGPNVGQAADRESGERQAAGEKLQDLSAASTMRGLSGKR